MPLVLDGTNGVSGVDGTAANPSYEGTDSNTGVFFPAADTIAFAQNGTESLRLNASGQVAVNAAGSASAPTITKADDLNTGIFFPAADTIAFAEGGTEAMRIDSSANVGIGTSSPSSKLHVAGGSGSTIRNTASAGSSWFVGSNVDSYILHNESNTPMLFTTNGTERVRIDASGNVGIGTSSPIRLLTVNGEYSMVVSGATAYFNVSDSAGSNGNTKSLVIRGLGSAGSAEVSLSSLTLNASQLFFAGTGGSTQMFPCRAWVNFNGTGTVAIRASGNVTSITDNGTGDYTVNFTNAMPDTSYTVVCSNGQDTPGTAALRTANPAQTTSVTTSGVRVISGFMGSGAANRTAEDCAVYNMAAFR